MSNPRDEMAEKTSQESKQGATDTSANAATPHSADPHSDEAQRSGRVAHDERGNSVWEWQLETGVYSRDISTQRLKKLDLNDLSIAETARHPRPLGLGEPQTGSGRAGKASPGGGFNPYDNSSTAAGNVANDPYNSVARRALKPEPAPTPRKQLDLKKLQEWQELRKRVEQNKREQDDED